MDCSTVAGNRRLARAMRCMYLSGVRFFKDSVDRACSGAVGYQSRSRLSPRSGALDLLDPLHFAHAGDFAHAADDALEVLHVGGVHTDVDGGVGLGGAGFDVADVGVGVADDGGDALEHSRTVVAKYD